jgi:hypothetical protein
MAFSAEGIAIPLGAISWACASIAHGSLSELLRLEVSTVTKTRSLWSSQIEISVTAGTLLMLLGRMTITIIL